jgi:hypothetical protein
MYMLNIHLDYVGDIFKTVMSAIQDKTVIQDTTALEKAQKELNDMTHYLCIPCWRSSQERMQYPSNKLGGVWTLLMYLPPIQVRNIPLNCFNFFHCQEKNSLFHATIVLFLHVRRDVFSHFKIVFLL